MRVDRAPDGTFYVLGQRRRAARRRSNDGMGVLPRRARRRRSSSCPGEFFDVNPGKRRRGRASRFRDYVRFSFGPSMAALEKAVARFEAMVKG